MGNFAPRLQATAYAQDSGEPRNFSPTTTSYQTPL